MTGYPMDISKQLMRDLLGSVRTTDTFNILFFAGGDKVPRMGGPGITQSDLLLINKVDLAPAIGADLAVMERDSRKMRGDGPFVFTQVKQGDGVDTVVEHVLAAREQAARSTASR